MPYPAVIITQLFVISVAPLVFAGSQFVFGGGLGGGLDQYYPPQPYSFGYDNADEYGTKSFHKEQGDASNTKTGTYGYSDANGIFRQVKYIADAGGFRAKVDTNEPGTEPGASADATYNARPLPAGPQYRVIGGTSRLSAPYTSASSYGAGYGGPWSG